MRKILVTGGAGFIGSELVRQLVDGGSHVTVVDNLANGQWENLEGVPKARCRRETADIRDETLMDELLAETEVVFHLACLGVRHSIHAQLENHDVNATATLELLGLARAHNIQRFVYVSTSEVYGTARWAPMTEEHPTSPNTVYGASKLAGECYARAYYETYRFPTVVVRPFNSYGPRCHHEGDCGEVMPKFLLRALARRPLIIFGDGTQTRDFTYVADTARGIIMAGLADACVGQTVNIGSGREISINELALMMSRVMGVKKPVIIHDRDRPGDVLRLCADSSRARKLCGFQARVSLDEGLAHLRDWYLSTGESAESLLEHEVVRNWEKQELPAPRASQGFQKNGKPAFDSRKRKPSPKSHPERPGHEKRGLTPTGLSKRAVGSQRHG